MRKGFEEFLIKKESKDSKKFSYKLYHCITSAEKINMIKMTVLTNK
jgi:hypothetical protein